MASSLVALHNQLVALARREGRRQEAEDLVQHAMMVAMEAGRFELTEANNAAWLRGVVRRQARMQARSARRRQARETAWQATQNVAAAPRPVAAMAVLDGLSPALRCFAGLVLSGHNRREIAYLLALSDTALRQRVAALKRHLRARGLSTPDELTGLGLDLAYGRLRAALRPALELHGGMFASHDPDGHLFIVRRSQNQGARQ